MRVIKISGHNLNDEAYVDRFAQAVAEIAKSEPVIIINGGGASIGELQAAFDIKERKIQGLRVTDEQSLKITEMVMSGSANKQVVRGLRRAGLNAMGLSGIDGGIMTAQKKILPPRVPNPDQRIPFPFNKPLPEDDLGFVGDIVSIDADGMKKLMDLGYTLVLSPVSCDEEGQHYNINADDAATAVAQGLAADQLDFVSIVPGVKFNLTDEAIIPILTPPEAANLIRKGSIQGGMIPKVNAALEGLEKGIEQVRIVDLDSMSDGGTIFKNA